MKAIRDFVGQPLIWAQPRAMEQVFELRCGSELLASLQWEDSWRSRAAAETAEGSWSFGRQGFWRKQVVIESNAGNAALPTLLLRGGTTTLRFPDGHSYLWSREGLVNTKHAWTMLDEAPLLNFKAHHQGLLQTENEVEIQPVAAALPELALLVTLGWYLVMLERSDAQAAAAVSRAPFIR